MCFVTLMTLSVVFFVFVFFCAMMLANVAQLYRTTSGFVETSRFSTITVCKDI